MNNLASAHNNQQGVITNPTNFKDAPQQSINNVSQAAVKDPQKYYPTIPASAHDLTSSSNTNNKNTTIISSISDGSEYAGGSKKYLHADAIELDCVAESNLGINKSDRGGVGKRRDTENVVNYSTPTKGMFVCALYLLL